MIHTIAKNSIFNILSFTLRRTQFSAYWVLHDIFIEKSHIIKYHYEYLLMELDICEIEFHVF